MFTTKFEGFYQVSTSNFRGDLSHIEPETEEPIVLLYKAKS